MDSGGTIPQEYVSSSHKINIRKVQDYDIFGKKTAVVGTP
jgi:hypothetical protein